MGMFNFQNFRKSSIYITPNFPVIETKRYKFTLFQLLWILAAYTFFIMLVVITILSLTPAKDLIFIFENEELKVQAERIKELENKVGFMTSELESLASSNKRLQYAIILAGTDSLDSTSTIYDSLRYEKIPNLPIGGNILLPVRKLLYYIFGYAGDSTTFFIKPTRGFIINEFDPSKGHMGIDYAVKVGSVVSATYGGIVVFADYTINDGYKIILEHNNGYISLYKHCSVLLKKERDYVIQGELIALSGNSGIKTTGPHLHFELWKNGRAIDPQKVLIN